MKKPTAILLILVSGVLTGITFVYLRYFYRQDKVSFPPQEIRLPITKLKTFKSSSLDFTVQLPEKYEIEEGVTFVDIKLGKDIISGVRNFDPIGEGSLEKYLEYADDKNEIISTSEKNYLNIKGHPAMSRKEIRGGVNKKAYYIYVSNTDKIVYVFSTKSESLYGDLDQIAQSFRYTP